MSRDPSKLPGKTEPLLEPPPGGYRDAAPREPPEPTEPIPEEKGWKAKGPLSAEDAAAIDEEIAFLSGLVAQLKGQGPHRYRSGWGNPGIAYWQDTQTGRSRSYPHDRASLERELATFRRLRAIDMPAAELSRRRGLEIERMMKSVERGNRWRAIRDGAQIYVSLAVILGVTGWIVFKVVRALFRWIVH
jgi:hypothetical protein